VTNKKETPNADRIAMLGAHADFDEALESLEGKDRAALARELESEGFDLAAEEARLRATLASVGAARSAKVVPLALRRRDRSRWALLAVAAVIALGIGYAWRTRRPEDPVAKKPLVPSAVPSSATSGLDVRGNAIKPPEEQYGAGHPDCVEVPPSGNVTVTGKVLRKGTVFVLDLDEPLCGAEPIEQAVLDPGEANLLPLVGRDARVEATTTPSDAARRYVLHVVRVSPAPQ
jgi:hypothetical protein